MYWYPVIDGEFLPDDPKVLLELGKVSQKDVLMGVNKDEGTVQTGMNSATMDTNTLTGSYSGNTRFTLLSWAKIHLGLWLQ